MVNRTKALLTGGYVALSVLVLAAVFFTVVFWGSEAAAKLPPPKLKSWDNSRVLSELGEAQQVGACDDILGAPGFTARYYLDEPHRRLLIVCVPTS